jgi:hypothetical protein
MIYYDYLKKLWQLTDLHNHCIDTELMAYHLTNQYIKNTNCCLTKELAYVTTVIAAKINEEGGGFNNLQYIKNKINNVQYIKKSDLIQFEKHVIKHVKLTQYPLIQQINVILLKNQCYKKLSPCFIYLLRYILWCKIDTNLPTFILAIHLLKNHKIQHELKFYKVFLIFNDLSYLTNIPIHVLIKEYNKIKLKK